MSTSTVRAASFSLLFANRAASQLEKDVLKVGDGRAEFSDPNPILRQAVNHVGDKIVSPPANGESHVGAGYRLNRWNCLKVVTCGWVVRIQNDGTLRAMAAD